MKGASKGEGLNKFLANIREVDAIVHVVRALMMKMSCGSKVEDACWPIKDIDTINLELILADLESASINATRRKLLNKKIRIHCGI